MEIQHVEFKLDSVIVVGGIQCPLNVKVTDFGLADSALSAVVSGVCVQTIRYRAPQVILQITDLEYRL